MHHLSTVLNISIRTIILILLQVNVWQNGKKCTLRLWVGVLGRFLQMRSRLNIKFLDLFMMKVVVDKLNSTFRKLLSLSASSGETLTTY